MTKACNVLIIADNESGPNGQLDAIVMRLTHSRLNCKICYLDGAKLKGVPKYAPDAVLFIFSNETPAILPVIIKKLTKSYAPAKPIILGVVNPGTQPERIDALESTLFLPVHPAQVASRIVTILRMGEIKQEIEFREQTYHSLTGQDMAESLSSTVPARLRVLFIGKAAPEFMSVMNAFNDSGVEVVAAFTSFTAFDFLHEQNFNAVVINAIHSTDSAFAIASTMRRNTKLFHVPAFALMGDQSLANEIDAYENGINDVLDANASATEVRGRIMELATYHRAHDYVRSLYDGFADGAYTEPASGLLNGAFFKAHMQRHFTRSQKQGNLLTLAQIKCTPTSENFDVTKIDALALRKALDQTGGMIKNMIRAQDCLARIDASQFAILFPNCADYEVEAITDRLSNIINCTAFDHFETAFKLSLSIKITQLSGNTEAANPAELARSA